MKVFSNGYARYIRSAEWDNKRNKRLAEDRWTCTRCPSHERLQVHHLTYDRLGHEDLDDLVTLCDACHAKEHGRDPDIPPEMPDSYYRARFHALHGVIPESDPRYERIWTDLGSLMADFHAALAQEQRAA